MPLPSLPTFRPYLCPRTDLRGAGISHFESAYSRYVYICNYRFWTQFEAWLSLQAVTEQGLAPAEEDERRCAVEPTWNATVADGRRVMQMWQNKTPEEAHDLLSLPDVTVTNAKDKGVQLKKLVALNEEVIACLEALTEFKAGAIEVFSVAN